MRKGMNQRCLEGRVEFRQYVEGDKLWIAFTQRLPSVNRHRPWLVWQNFYAIELPLRSGFPSRNETEGEK